jgi:hypothetical protein
LVDVAGGAHWALPECERRVGWQPSRFLADRAEAERAFALAERLGSVNAAQELGTTWPLLRKALISRYSSFRCALTGQSAADWPRAALGR